MDKFKQAQHKYVCIGGIHCHCCNSFHHKSKSKLNRLARSSMKQELVKIKQGMKL